MKLVDQNSLVYLSIILLSLVLAVAIHPICLLLWPVSLLLDDFMYYRYALSLFDPEQRIQRGYQFGHVFLDAISGDGRDLGFNLFDEDLEITASGGSQEKKWAFVFEQLELSVGDSLIDIGCGYGDWLNYARSKGLSVVGVNISHEQSIAARETFELEILCCNWKDIPLSKALQHKLYGRFDAVTMMDTIEHYVPARYSRNQKKKQEIYRDLFAMSSRLLKPDTVSGRVFISCLHHVQQETNWKERMYVYLLDHYHSGSYPGKDDGLTKWSQPYFRELERWDKTEDYRLTSVNDRNHFGAPKIRWSLKKVKLVPVLFLLDPHHLHKWLCIKVDAWMNWHFGESAWIETYRRPEGLHQGQARLWWLLLEKHKSFSAGRTTPIAIR